MDRSLLEIAHDYILSCDKPQNIDVIFAEVQKQSGLSDEDFMAAKAQFYTDFTLCSNFIYCGKGDWDIKTRQPIDLYDCDSSFFLDPEEKKELQEARKRRQRKEQDASADDNDSIAGYEGVEEYVERDDADDSYDDIDSDDLLMHDDHDYDDDDEDEEYDDLLDQYEDLYED